MTNILQQALQAGKIRAGASQGEEEFRPLPLTNLTVGRAVPFEIYIKIKPKDQALPQFVKVCSRGEVFQKEWHEKLTQLRIPGVYVAKAEGDAALQYLQDNLEQVLADTGRSKMEKWDRVCDAAQLWTLNFFSSKEARTQDQVKLGLQFVDSMFEVFKGGSFNLRELLEIKHQQNLPLYTHCLNVCLLGMAFTHHLGWPPENIRGFGLGALIHDIGMLRIPREILEKKGKLTDEEMSVVKRHPMDGFRKVQATAHLRWEALQMMLQHHENGDGSGYPMGLKAAKIHPWARILRILDSYEAMTSKRPWRPAMEPKEALWIMHRDWKEKNLFDSYYLKAFFKFMGK